MAALPRGRRRLRSSVQKWRKKKKVQAGRRNSPQQQSPVPAAAAGQLTDRAAGAARLTAAPAFSPQRLSPSQHSSARDAKQGSSTAPETADSPSPSPLPSPPNVPQTRDRGLLATNDPGPIGVSPVGASPKARYLKMTADILMPGPYLHPTSRTAMAVLVDPGARNSLIAREVVAGFRIRDLPPNFSSLVLFGVLEIFAAQGFVEEVPVKAESKGISLLKHMFFVASDEARRQFPGYHLVAGRALIKRWCEASAVFRDWYNSTIEDTFTYPFSEELSGFSSAQSGPGSSLTMLVRQSNVSDATSRTSTTDQSLYPYLIGNREAWCDFPCPFPSDSDSSSNQSSQDLSRQEGYEVQQR